MEARSMEITLISARDLKNTKLFSKTKAYAVAWISNDHNSRQRTPVDNNGSTDPVWNHFMKFTLDEAALQQGRLSLEIAIYADATFGDKGIGRVSIPLKEFLKPTGDNTSAATSVQFVNYQLRKPSGKAKGILNLSVKLAGKAEIMQQPQPVAGSYGAARAEPVTAYPAGSYGASKTEPVTAYPVYPPAGLSSHPPTNSQYPPPPYPAQAGYPPPPPYYQGYPPNQGYPPYQGYPPVAQQPPRRKNKLGMGMGTGLLGGALGGLLLGDIISDAGNGGFGDGGGYGGGDGGGYGGDGGFGDGGDFGGDF